MDRGPYDHREHRSSNPRRRFFIGETGDQISNRGIWHSELRPARLQVPIEAQGARGGENDGADNLSGDIDVRVRHTAVYLG